MLLGHGVQCTAILEPLNLTLIEGVIQLDVKRLAAICGMHAQSHGFVDGQLGAQQVYLVIRLDLVVVGRVSEGQGQHALFLEVGFVLDVRVSLHSCGSE